MSSPTLQENASWLLPTFHALGNRPGDTKESLQHLTARRCQDSPQGWTSARRRERIPQTTFPSLFVRSVDLSISLDHDLATAILFEEANAAQRGVMTQTATTWAERVRNLGVLCPHGRSSTIIAALGTALLAKATDDRVDVYSLLDRGEAPESYSARSLADNVWARHRGQLNIDLGANGANPLNNTPFIGKTRIDQITGVRNKAGWTNFLECMRNLSELDSASQAKEALRGFILARSRSLLPALEIDPQTGDHLTSTRLIEVITAYVAESSEGGRRAQAAVAAMLDAAFGAERVVVGTINDPDRRAPLDISVIDSAGGFVIAFEVKDKPVAEHLVRASVEKAVQAHGVRNIAFVAINSQQRVRNFDGGVLNLVENRAAP